jgi:ferritin
MINEKIEKAMNEQINHEIYSSYLYLSMSAYFSSLNLNGFANWMRVQAKEEDLHAMKFYDYIIERGGRVTLETIKGPETTWDSPLVVFESAYKHEIFVTSLINNLVDIAITERDHASNSFLKWFVDEQVEEEASADKIVQELKFIGDNRHALFMIDRELATRVFIPPVTPA